MDDETIRPAAQSAFHIQGASGWAAAKAASARCFPIRRQAADQQAEADAAEDQHEDHLECDHLPAQIAVQNRLVRLGRIDVAAERPLGFLVLAQLAIGVLLKRPDVVRAAGKADAVARVLPAAILVDILGRDLVGSRFSMVGLQVGADDAGRRLDPVLRAETGEERAGQPHAHAHADRGKWQGEQDQAAGCRFRSRTVVVCHRFYCTYSSAAAEILVQIYLKYISRRLRIRPGWRGEATMLELMGVCRYH